MANVFKDVDIYLYNMEVAPTRWTEKEARAEYARLAAVANKRIRRLQESAYKSSAAAQHVYFPTSAKQFKTARQVYGNLQNVARFVNKESSSISGQRRQEMKQLEAMRERGYTFLTKGNIHQFREFWKEVRSHEANRFKDSEQVVELFKTAKEKRIDPLDLAKDFQFWIEHQQELSSAKRSNSTITSEEARERLGI